MNIGIVSLVNLNGILFLLGICLCKGAELLQIHRSLAASRACCFSYWVFTVCPCSTSQQASGIHHCWLHALLPPCQDLKRIAQTLREISSQRPQSEAEGVLIPFYR